MEISSALPALSSVPPGSDSPANSAEGEFILTLQRRPREVPLDCLVPRVLDALLQLRYGPLERFYGVLEHPPVFGCPQIVEQSGQVQPDRKLVERFPREPAVSHRKASPPRSS